jgi:hypothetical protein
VSSFLSLNRLKQGYYGISRVLGAAHAEACLVSLEHHKHQSGIILRVEGTFTNELQLTWSDTVTKQIERSWDDMINTVEWAACGIAFLLMEELTGFTVIRQARKGNGFDYWLGNENKDTRMFQEKAYLEVSGILKAGQKSTIKARLTQKLAQIDDVEDIPAYAIVVEFSQPLALIGKI